MYNDMFMCVVMLLGERVNYDNYSSQNHYSESNKRCPKWFFLKNNKR